MLTAEVEERLNDRFSAVVLIEQPFAQELELVTSGECPVAVDGERVSEVLGRVKEVEDLRSFGERGQIFPVVATGVGDASLTRLTERIRSR